MWCVCTCVCTCVCMCVHHLPRAGRVGWVSFSGTHLEPTWGCFVLLSQCHSWMAALGELVPGCPGPGSAWLLCPSSAFTTVSVLGKLGCPVNMAPGARCPPWGQRGFRVEVMWHNVGVPGCSACWSLKEGAQYHCPKTNCEGRRPQAASLPRHSPL
jgi:hypothetical protein